jgi:hypothetical protein
MIKQNSKEEILREPGVNVLFVKKGSRLEDHSFDADEPSVDSRVRLPGKTNNKIKNRSFSALGFNLVIVALMLFGYRFFAPTDKPSVLIDGYLITLNATGHDKGVQWLIEIKKTKETSIAIDNVTIKVHQNGINYVNERPVPIKVGEITELAGILEAADPKENLFAEISIGAVSSSLSIRPIPDPKK